MHAHLASERFNKLKAFSPLSGVLTIITQKAKTPKWFLPS